MIVIICQVTIITCNNTNYMEKYPISDNIFNVKDVYNNHKLSLIANNSLIFAIITYSFKV